MSVPIERTLRLATSVDELADAWAFIMARLDEVGPDPEVSIRPVWAFSAAALDVEQDPPRRFEVVVSGMVPEEEG